MRLNYKTKLWYYSFPCNIIVIIIRMKLNDIIHVISYCRPSRPSLLWECQGIMAATIIEVRCPGTRPYAWRQRPSLLWESGMEAKMAGVHSQAVARMAGGTRAVWVIPPSSMPASIEISIKPVVYLVSYRICIIQDIISPEFMVLYMILAPLIVWNGP